ncbi:MAG TPA: glycosyltransferase family 2 protein [Chitinophagaceae bacterium]|nr:glycosyltransferase family 2 protein [Chitinophagaceae bacterium]
MDITIVVPLKDEAESLPELCSWIARIMESNNFSYEVILVDDGSTDDSWKVISRLAGLNPVFRGLRFQRNYGKSAALNEGFHAARGQVVITMDADLQDSPDEVPALYRMIREEGFDLVSGWKKIRYDNTITKNFPSRLYNWAARKVSGIPLHDFNCGLKAYRLKVVKSIEVYGEMHRYIPVIAKWSGFNHIGEKVVEHRPRKYGVSKFGWERFLHGLLDLMSIIFIGRFGKKPMHLFGLLGTLAFLLGLVISVYLGVAKFVFKVYNMTERPIFYIALVAMIMGVQLFLAGFLAELTVRNSQERNKYLVDERTGF